MILLTQFVCLLAAPPPQQAGAGDQGQNNVAGGPQPQGQEVPAPPADPQNAPNPGANFVGPRAQFPGNFPPMFAMPHAQFAFRPPVPPQSGQTPAAGGDFTAGAGPSPYGYPFTFPPMPYIPLGKIFE